MITTSAIKPVKQIPKEKGPTLPLSKLIEHKHYIDKHGQDMPEILHWKWTNNK